MKCPFLSLLIGGSLKPVLLDIRIATSAYFLGPLFSLTSYSEAVSVHEVEVCFLYTVKRWLLIFFIQSVNFCHFIGELSPFILRDINGQ